MNFDEFKEYVKAEVRNYLPVTYLNAEICIKDVVKLDEQYTGMMVRRAEDVSSPIINLDAFYEQLADRSLEATLEQMARVITMNVLDADDLTSLEDYEKIKRQLFMRLSPVDGNDAIMNDSPHKVVGDILVTYHVYLPSEAGGFYSARVTNQLMGSFKITTNDLHRTAQKNTLKLFKPTVQSLVEVMTGEKEDDPTFMVVSNEEGIFGANTLFCEGIMDGISNLVQGNYYAIPSSIHEWLVIPSGRFTAFELKQMVESANHTVVRPEDILSYNVYHYDAETKVFAIAETNEEASA